jgi:predicted dehydrogenase
MRNHPSAGYGTESSPISCLCSVLDVRRTLLIRSPSGCSESGRELGVAVYNNFAFHPTKGPMENVVRVGILGLGRRWQKRYKPALRALRHRFSIRVLCDQVHQRATVEAKRLGCQVAAGPTQLLEREDVDAVLLLDSQWFGLWPLARACQASKPVFCCGSLEADEAHADLLCRQVKESRLPVVMEMVPRFAPVTPRLRELFETVLGKPRLLLCEVLRAPRIPSRVRPAGLPQPSPVAQLLGGAGVNLLDWCAGLFQGEPLTVTAKSLQAIGFSNILWQFSAERGLQITRRPFAIRRPAVRLEVVAERGLASLELPYRISWFTNEGSHSQEFQSQRSLAELQLEHFLDVISGRAPKESTLDDAQRALRWLRAASRSREEGRTLSLTP